MIDSLLGLDRLSVFSDGAYLSFKYALPAWAWALVMLLLLVFSVWSYSRMLGPAWARTMLAGVRTLSLVLVAFLLAGPQWQQDEEVVEPDHVVVLVDRSASMSVRDSADATRLGMSRDEAMRDALDKLEALGDENPFSEQTDRRIVWLGFDQQAYSIDPADMPNLDEAGVNTQLRTAIDQALYRLSGRPLSGIVVMSDGRSPQALDPSYLEMLDQRRAAVFPVPLGSRELPLDLVIDRVEAPSRAFVDDRAPVRVKVDVRGAEAGDLSRLVRLRLLEGDRVLQERVVPLSELEKEQTLAAVTDEPGRRQWRVEVALVSGIGGGGDAGAVDGGVTVVFPDETTELVTANNEESFDIELIDQPLKVLYVEGYPRWEYRYLVSLLKRETSIQSSVLLLSAERGFAQEGNLPITRFPRDMEELSPYDVIIIGDVPPRYFGEERPSLIREHVAQNGAGLLWIGGSRNNPNAYDATVLSELLVMSEPAVVIPARVSRSGFQVEPTAAADRLGVMSLVETQGVSGAVSISETRAEEPELASQNWPDDLPALLWMQQTTGLKPTAQVLARATDPVLETTVPFAVLMQYGGGQSLYVASDDTWRWRYARGELYHERFWIQLIRLMGRNRLDVAGRRAALIVEPQRVGVDEAAMVRLRLFDSTLIHEEQRRVTVSIMRQDETGSRAAGELTLLRQRQSGSADGSTGSESWSGLAEFTAIWRPSRAGRYELVVTDVLLDTLDLREQVEVISADDELRQPQADHARLAELAAGSGGRVVTLDELASLDQWLPNRRRVSINSLIEPLWYAPIWFVLFVVLVTGEWIGRKLIRLA